MIIDHWRDSVGKSQREGENSIADSRSFTQSGRVFSELIESSPANPISKQCRLDAAESSRERALYAESVDGQRIIWLVVLVPL